jgi:nicotinate-nucleotide adenylyltransferase
MRIGLLGGSFNPPHAAHRDVSLLALRRLALDRVWWLVTPGNPLKDTRGLPALAERLRQARDAADHPSIEVTDLEARLGTRYTFDTVRRIRQRFAGVRFVFVMGADILPEFHRWRRWRELARSIPLAVVDRPGFSLRALGSPAAQAMLPARLPEHAASMLASREPPAWVYLHGLRSARSSTQIRASRRAALQG